MKSTLQNQPKSVVLEKGYINVYSKLDPKERRQLEYKRRYKKENPLWDETLVYLSAQFSQLCPLNAIVLDAGCGNGNYLIDENRAKIAWAVGLDVNKAFTSKNICLDEIKMGQLEKLPFEANYFDIVISLWVLEHLREPVKVFSEINRVLKPGGVFMFATPNSNYFPLKVMSLLKSLKLNHWLNKLLFGRAEQDIFQTHYKANTLGKIQKLADNLFKVEELRLNSDVSYTAFNGLSYFATKMLLKLPRMFEKYTYSHIVGILHKM